MAIEIVSRKIRADWIAVVSQHGGMMYITIPKRLVEYYDLRIRDKLRVHVDEVKRERAVVEDEPVE